MNVVDLSAATVRELNAALHAAEGGTWRVLNSRGAHALAVGLNAPVRVEIAGHVGYYCAGMNQLATAVVIEGNAGTGLAENMMSGLVRVKGNASQSAGATAHGGLLVIDGDASARCGISMKGIDIVVKRIGRPHERVHGPGRKRSWSAATRGRRAGRFHL